MSFNHYAKMKMILSRQKSGWYVKRINKPTKAQNFKGETIYYPHYYRIYTTDAREIKFCKFQQLDRFAKTMNLAIDEIVIYE